MSIPSGTQLGRYEILSKIGEGGMGEVYLAQDTKLDRKVAIKFLNEEFSKDADKLGRFLQGAKAAGRNVETGQHVHQGRFAAARFADDSDAIAPLDAKIDIFESVKTDTIANIRF